ncbi:MAG: glycosyltransferase [Sedimentisphaerales bacterium]|nr:glycosyltransferase [Sedimentisphaerales bacterium]
MSDKTRLEYEQAVEFAEQGQHEQALAAIERYLQTSPADAEALNDAGAICHCLGKSAKAIGYLNKARQLDPENKQVLANLLETLIGAQMPEQAEQLFDHAQSFDILNPDLLNRTANMYLAKQNKAGAVEVLLRSLKLWPQQEILEHMLTVLKSKRPKIAFICGADGRMFLNHISDFLQERFETRFFEGRTEQQLYDLMKWSDISWFEWCTNLAVIGTKGPKVCKNIVRLHRYEAYMDWPKQVNWQNVDVLVTVGNSFVKNALTQMVPNLELATKVITVPNGVELDNPDGSGKFIDRPKGKNLACVGYINMRKNPVFLLQCMQKLHYMDAEYKLFFAGYFQDGTLEQYIRHMARVLGLENVVFFDGWQDDVPGWLADKHYIVSASIGESQGMAIAEAMAAGLKPVIHNFPGASEIYPEEFLFNIAEQFCEQILSQDYQPLAYRQYIEERYCHRKVLKKINDIFTTFEKEMDSKKVAANPQFENVLV